MSFGSEYHISQNIALNNKNETMFFQKSFTTSISIYRT